MQQTLASGCSSVDGLLHTILDRKCSKSKAGDRASVEASRRVCIADASREKVRQSLGMPLEAPRVGRVCSLVFAVSDASHFHHSRIKRSPDAIQAMLRRCLTRQITARYQVQCRWVWLFLFFYRRFCVLYLICRVPKCTCVAVLTLYLL